MILTDFQILQRDADGYARITWEDTLNAPIAAENVRVVARVVREDDNLTLIHWTPCTLAEDGLHWSVALTLPEGGLYRIEAALQPGESLWIDKIACVYHVGVGDIFVTAGQSNMTGYGRDAAYDPPCLGVHAFTNRGVWSVATHPLADALHGIYGNPENGTGTSPALSFARRLHERLGVPIGILPTAVGGSPLSRWSPAEKGDCYREMVKRIHAVGNFRGFIWLQGCSDANENDAPHYLERFTRMVQLWREELGPHPIITAQLNRWAGNENDSRYWGMIRDAQRRAALEMDDVYVVPTIDLSTTDGIHNSSGANVVIGERLANTALACLYGKPGQTAVSVLAAEAVDETHILVHLTPGRRVLAMDNCAFGMNVEDASGLIDCIKADPQKDGLLVSTARPYAMPAQFHYAWKTQPPVFVVRDFYDMPILACYGIPVQEKKNTGNLT